MRYDATHIVSKSLAEVLVAVVLAATAGLASVPVMAQAKSVPQPDSPVLPFVATDVTSPDGTKVAHFGNALPVVVYVRDVNTSQDTVVAKGPTGGAEWNGVESMSFSPDGSKLVFEAGPRMYMGKIYSVLTDGSNARKDGTKPMVLASDGPLQPTSEPGPIMLITNPMYSPDGSKILVHVRVTNGKTDEEGHKDHSEDKNYVGLISPNEPNQSPQRLTEGAPLFWGHAGNVVYYNKLGVVYRYDLGSQQSKAVLDAHKFVIIGRVPGADAAFVSTPDQKSAPLTAVSLDGSAVPQSFKDFAASLPKQDVDGRSLAAIEEGGPHKLTLKYKPSLDFLKGGVTPDVMKEMKDGGKLDEATQQVSFQ